MNNQLNYEDLGKAVITAIENRPVRHDLLISESYVGYWSWDSKLAEWVNLWHNNLDELTYALNALSGTVPESDKIKRMQYIPTKEGKE